MNVGIKGVLRCIIQTLKKTLEKLHKKIKIEARNGATENYNNHIVTHPINEEKDTIENVVR